jgi:hypothetical protein
LCRLIFVHLELLRVDSLPVTNSTRHLSCHVSDDNEQGIDDDDDDADADDILETTTWENSPKRMKRWVDVNEN